MAERKKVAWTGALGSIAVTCILQADRLAKLFGIINIPKDARETMSALASAPTLLPAGILLIGAACVLYLYLEHLNALRRRCWNPKLDLLTIGLLGMVLFAVVAAVGLYRQTSAVASTPEKDPLVKNVAGPPVEWRFDKPVTIFMYSRKPGGAVKIDAIQIHGKNTSDFALKDVSALITADIKTAQVFTMRVNPHGTLLAPLDSAKLIPPRADFDLMMPVREGGLIAEDFLKEYGTLQFIFSYEENGTKSSFREQFPFSYLEDQIVFLEEQTKDHRRSIPTALEKRSDFISTPHAPDAIQRLIERRDRFTLAEAACLLAGTEIRQENIVGPASSYLYDIKGRIIKELIMPMNLGRFELAQIRMDRQMLGLGTNAPRSDLRNDLEISKEVLRELAEEFSIQVPGIS